MTNGGIANDVLLTASEIAVGESVYTDCPICGGKGKFSVTIAEDGGVLYHCFRASCPAHSGGRVRDAGNLVRTRPTKIRACRPWTGTVREITDGQLAELFDCCGFCTDHIYRGRVKYADSMGRYAYPIISPLGQRRGWVLRSYTPGVEPKALTYMDGPTPRTSYYHKDRSVLVVVEDIPSAIRASRYYSASALLGTSANVETVEEMAQHYDHIVWALDADAVAQARRLYRTYQLMARSSQLLMLPCDLKDMTEDQLEAFLKKGVRRE